MKTVIIMITLSLISCASKYGSATPGFWKPASDQDPESKFGILIQPNSSSK